MAMLRLLGVPAQNLDHRLLMYPRLNRTTKLGHYRNPAGL
jgi:hypothetical protein